MIRPMHEIADPHPRASLLEELRRFRMARDAMAEAGMPMFVPGGILPGLKGILLDPNETSHVFTLFESLIGPLEVRGVGHFLASERGRALLEARPDLVGALSDRDYLASLPEGSLGRAYLEFVTREGITADGLVAASEHGAHLLRPREAGTAFIGEYLRDTHDLWHVVTGYGGDVIGELALLAFSFAQMGNLGIGLLVGLSVTLGAVLPTPIDRDGRRAIVNGYLRGRGSRWLPTVDWLPLLERPLAEVRRGLGVSEGVTYRELRVPKGESIIHAAA
jgi:ubiquinone biosynthesis protein COQ4